MPVALRLHISRTCAVKKLIKKNTGGKKGKTGGGRKRREKKIFFNFGIHAQVKSQEAMGVGGGLNSLALRKTTQA